MDDTVAARAGDAGDSAPPLRQPEAARPLGRGEPFTLRDRHQDRLRWGWPFAALWLLFLTKPLSDGLQDPNRWRGGLAVVAVTVFAVLFVTGWLTIRAARVGRRPLSRRFRFGLLGTQVTLALIACLTTGQAGLDTAPFLIVLTMMALRPRHAVFAVGALMIVVLGSTEVVPGWHLTTALASGLVLTAFIMLGMLRMIQRNVELAQQAELAVAQERARFARDLHDVLGHSLTLLAMKAELAGRLVRADPGRAETEIADVERLARDALADVRAAVGGYRRATLLGELVAARAALDAAGIDAELPATVDDVPGERRELFGWAVREGVTNVVRHSRARWCRVVVDRDGVEIVDDGCGPAPADGGAAGSGSGHGLAGLRERAEAAGAHVAVGRSGAGGFRLRVGW